MAACLTTCWPCAPADPLCAHRCSAMDVDDDRLASGNNLRLAHWCGLEACERRRGRSGRVALTWHRWHIRWHEACHIVVHSAMGGPIAGLSGVTGFGVRCAGRRFEGQSMGRCPQRRRPPGPHRAGVGMRVVVQRRVCLGGRVWWPSRQRAPAACWEADPCCRKGFNRPAQVHQVVHGNPS